MREIRKKRAVAVEVRRERKWLICLLYTSDAADEL